MQSHSEKFLSSVNLLITLSVLGINTNAFASKGGDSSGGGDGITAYRNMISKFVSKNLKIRVKNFITSNLSAEAVKQIADPSVETLLEQLVSAGLESDVENSSYIPGAPCFDTVLNPPERRGASALIGQPGTNICFDTNLLVSQNVTVSVLVGLALHEHAHHVGMNEDQAQLIQAFVSAKIMDEGSNEDQIPFDELNKAPVTSIKSGDKLCIRSSFQLDSSTLFFDGKMMGNIPYATIPQGLLCTYMVGETTKYRSPVNVRLMGLSKVPAGTVVVNSVSGPFLSGGQVTGHFSIDLTDGDSIACEKTPSTQAVPTLPEVFRAMRGYIEPGKCN